MANNAPPSDWEGPRQKQQGARAALHQPHFKQPCSSPPFRRLNGPPVALKGSRGHRAPVLPRIQSWNDPLLSSAPPPTLASSPVLLACPSPRGGRGEMTQGY